MIDTHASRLLPTRVPFHGGEIIAIAGATPDATLVVLAPIVAALGLDWSGQFRRIKRNPVLREGIAMMTIPSPGGPQEAVCLRLSRLGFWLATVNADRIPDPITRQRIILYQREAADALHAHFFGNPAASPAPAIPDIRDPAARRLLIQSFARLDELDSEVARLATANAELTPKAQALDRLATATGALCPTDAAKALKIKPTDLFTYLRNHDWIYRRHGRGAYVGYQDRTRAGLLEHRVTTIRRPDGTEKLVEQVLITPKGLAHLSALVPGAAR
jgi:phage antirepressor YoqD-like protein